jgi:hypothetical protein
VSRGTVYGSPRRYDGLPELTYPFHDRDILVTACGRLCLHRKRINISSVLAGQRLGIKESQRGHLARQLHALRSRILRPGAENPATSRQPVRHEVVTHVLGTTCHLCVRAGQPKCWRARRDSNPRPPDSKSGLVVLNRIEPDGLAPAECPVYKAFASRRVRLGSVAVSDFASPVCPQPGSQTTRLFQRKEQPCARF